MGIPIAILGWFGPLCLSLRNVLASPPAEVHLFRRALGHSVRYGQDLTACANNNPVKIVGRTEEFPLATCLLSTPQKPSSLERTLVWLLLEAHLARGHEDLTVSLAEIIRGVTRRATSRLRDTIAACDGPTSLIATMNRLKGIKPELGITGHTTFDTLWRNELEAFCFTLVRHAEQGPDELDATDRAPLDQPGVWTEDPLGEEGEDLEEGVSYPSLSIGPQQKIPVGKMRRSLDWANHMARCSSPDLLRPMGNVLPADLREWSWRQAVGHAENALAQCNVSETEYWLAQILAIESGLNSREAVRLGIGTTTNGQIPVIDLRMNVLRRPELLPPSYFTPGPTDNRWLPTGGDAIFPLSPKFVALVERLVAIRDATSQALPDSLLLTGTIDPYRLRIATKSEYRIAVAVGIADKLGVDAAQRAFGDSFGLSTAPVFYGSYPALDLASTVAGLNSFAMQGQDNQLWAAATGHVLGSRTRPKDPHYGRAWKALQWNGKRPRGRPSDSRVLQDWKQRRDRVVVHLMLATGIRPSRGVADIHIHDFLPTHALAVVSDKVSDPAHATRLVCTGWKFVGELETFVNELQRIARNCQVEGARELASSILHGRTPLFSLPGEKEPEPLDIRKLLGDLDPIWSYRPNLHRHGLYQFLIECRIDHELRHFQMGWLIHEHHATSDSAPFAPAKLGHELADVIDRWLSQCGWLGGQLARDPAGLVPLASLRDWTPVRTMILAESDAAFSSLRAQLKEVERSLGEQVWGRIRQNTKTVLTWFDAVGSSERPCFNPRAVVPSSANQPAVISQLQVEGLLAPFLNSSSSKAERYVAAKILRRALLATARKHNVRVYLPETQALSRHRIPSPFLPEMGLAVAQIGRLQAALVAQAATLGNMATRKQVSDLAAIAVLTIVTQTPYCELDDAFAVLRGAGECKHSTAEPSWLRVPFGKGHVILAGDQAVLAHRLSGLDGWREALDALSRNGYSALVDFVRKLLPDLCNPHDKVAEIASKLVDTARVASTASLNGAERLIMNHAVTPATTSAGRAAAVADDVTGGNQTEAEGVSSAEARQPGSVHPGSGRNPSHGPLRDISRVIRAFHPDFCGEILGEAAAPATHRRPQLKRLLENAFDNVGAKPTASRLILEYAWQLLVKGGPRSRSGQAISTINKTLQRLSLVFRNLGPEVSFEEISNEELTAVCHAACSGSKRKNNREVLDELRRFFAYSSNGYQLAAPDWDSLYRMFGIAIAYGDPGLVGDAEALRVVGQLHEHLLQLDNADVDPSERRFREVCLVAALLAEASGARPGSIYGLTLGDVVLGTEADYIHLKARGRYASIKTRTAAGYVPLEGEIWGKYAGWFSVWLANACATIPPDALDTIPLFQIPGEPVGVRYRKDSVFAPLGDLIRWSTQEPRGRTYWLRKRRVRARHLAVQAKADSRARDLAHAMRLDGHALLATPLSRYVSDPKAYSPLDVTAHAITTRSGAIAMAGLTAGQANRLSANGLGTLQERVARILRLGGSSVDKAELPDAPSLPSYRSDMTLVSLERVLRDLVSGRDTGWIISRYSVQRHQVESTMSAISALEARLEIRLGVGKGQLGPPRYGRLAEKVLRLLQEEDARLLPVADDWVAVSSAAQLEHGCCLHGRAAVKCFAGLAADLGLQSIPTELAKPHGVSVYRLSDEKGSTYGAWRALRWVLAVVWVMENRTQQGRTSLA